MPDQEPKDNKVDANKDVPPAGEPPKDAPAQMTLAEIMAAQRAALKEGKRSLGMPNSVTLRAEQPSEAKTQPVEATPQPEESQPQAASAQPAPAPAAQANPAPTTQTAPAADVQPVPPPQPVADAQLAPADPPAPAANAADDLPPAETMTADEAALLAMLDAEEAEQAAKKAAEIAATKAAEALADAAAAQTVQSAPAQPQAQQVVAAASHEAKTISPATALSLIADMPKTRPLPVMALVIGINGVLILATIFVLIMIWTSSSSAPPSPATLPPQEEPTVIAIHHPVEVPRVAAMPTSDPVVLPQSQPAPPEVAPSWEMAEKAFAAQNYSRALPLYQQLLKRSQASAADSLVSDFLTLRIGQCALQLSQADVGRDLLQVAAQSDSLIVRAMACYQVAALDAIAGENMRARSGAYTALAALAGLSKKCRNMEANCDFLVGRMISEKVNTIAAGDVTLPWKDIPQTDPFAGLDEQSLRTLLRDGLTDRPSAALGPQIAGAGDSRIRIWRVTADRVPLEDLLARFASAARIELAWESPDSPARRRPVTLNFTGASEQRMAEVAAGMVGLIAKFSPDRIDVADPTTPRVLTQQRQQLAAEASAVWRRFVLRYPDDRRLPQAHFALACLADSAGDTVEALREYQLTAARFGNDKVAPYSLLRAALLRMQLRDYTAARTDLLDLLDRYPNAGQLDKVYLNLAAAGMEIGQRDEASKNFQKLYHLNLSQDTRQQSALGAATCEYHQARYDEAIKWFARYFEFQDRVSNEDLAKANLLLARCHMALDKPRFALAPATTAARLHVSTELHVQALLELADIQLKAQRYAAALQSLVQVATENLSPAQNYQYIAANLRAYRAMGLPDKAITFGKRRIDALRDEPNQALLKIELAKCFADSGDLSEAAAIITQAITRLPAGDDAAKATFDLADVCIRNHESPKAVMLLERMLQTQLKAPLRQRAIELLGQAYTANQEFEKAAKTFALLAPNGAKSPS